MLQVIRFWLQKNVISNTLIVVKISYTSEMKSNIKQFDHNRAVTW